jgi:uncharacterized coiled-coil protein SlyX
MNCPAQYRILLHELLSNGTGFKALSDWMVVNSSQHQLLVSFWCEELKKSKPCQIELFFRLLNLVVRHKEGKQYLLHFRNIIEDVFNGAVKSLSAKDEEIMQKLQEMVQLWHSNEIFGPTLGDKLQKCLTTHKKLLKLQELFPERVDPELSSVLNRYKGNLDAAVSHFVPEERPRNDLETTLKSLEIPSNCCWADVEDDTLEHASEGRNAHKSSSSSSRENQSAKHAKPPLTQSHHNKSSKETKVAKSADSAVDLSNLGEAELRYVQSMEKRVEDLEEVISKQNADIERLGRNYVKIEDFVKELRVECGKLIQKKLSAEHGQLTLPGTQNRDSESTPRSCRSRTSVETTPRLNPDAPPFVPNSISSFSSSCTGSLSSESPEVTEVC